MFIRRRKHNRPLAGILLVVFLFVSVFTETSGTLSSYVKALGCSFEKSKQSAPAAYQFPYEGTEKEEKKSEDKSDFASFHFEGVLALPDESKLDSFYADPNISGHASIPPLFLLIRSLRL